MQPETICSFCGNYCSTKEIKSILEAAARFIRENSNRSTCKKYDLICPGCRQSVQRKFDNRPIANKIFKNVGILYWDLIDKEPMAIKEAMNNGFSGHTNRELLLQLECINEQSRKNISIRFDSTDTVVQVIKAFHKKIALPDGTHNLTLIKYSINNKWYSYSSDSLERTLEELKLEDYSVLQFGYRQKQGSIVQSPPAVKPLQLRVSWPLHQRSMSFDYTNYTTVGKLIDAIRNEFKINSPIEQMKLETSYGLIEIDNLEQKLASSSAIPRPGPTIFLSLANDETPSSNMLTSSTMNNVVSTVITTPQSLKTDRNICIRVHCLFSTHVLTLVMSLNETIYDLKQYIINDHIEKGLDMKIIELGIIKPHRELNLPDNTSLADANIETETHLYADQIPSKLLLSKSNSHSENHHKTGTIISQTKPTTIDKPQTNSASCSQSSSTGKKRSYEVDHLTVQSTKPGMADTELVNKSVVNTTSFSTSLSVTTSLAKTLLPTRVLPIGLLNTGNTCFMNSALQCLAHVPHLVRHFLSLFHQQQSNRNHNTNLENCCDVYGETVGVFAYLMYQLWEGSCRPVDPDRMQTLVGRIAPRFITNRQQDVQEFMTFLFDCLHCELKQNIRSKSVDVSKTIIEQQFFGTIKSYTICSVCQTKEETTNIISFLPLPLERQERIFTILYVFSSGATQQYQCSAFSTDRLENLLDNFVKQNRLTQRHLLSVSAFNSSSTYISPKTSLNEISDHGLIIREEKSGPFFRPSSITQRSNSVPLTLMDCLDEFLAVELLDGSWFCKSKCKIEVESVARKMSLCVLPPVLIFQLKRFSETNGNKHKINRIVTFPLNGLDLSELTVEKYSKSTAPIYDLVAVSNHIGAMFGGHYTTYARQLPDGKWYDFNDTDVREIPSTEVITQNAYLLVYIRRGA